MNVNDLKAAIRGHARHISLLFACAGASVLLTACGTFPGWLSSDGPSRQQVQGTQSPPGLGSVQLVDIDAAVARKLAENHRHQLFSEAFADSRSSGYAVGPGDMIAVTIWEAPPAILFGAGMSIQSSLTSSSSSGAAALGALPAAQTATFPAQMVSREGTINVPFAGRLTVAGHDPAWIEAEIVKRLERKANQPQVMVQVVLNVTSNVTVVGEVNNSLRMPLTAKGESLLDALAAAGGVKAPFSKATVQITRGSTVRSLPLETIVHDPSQNIVLQPGDVITALYQPMSFMVLGATGKNDEVNFEAQGISLVQALARVGGLDDMRADSRSVFVFRFEDRSALDWPVPPAATPDGKVPVIYQLNLKDPAAFFVAQNFPVQNRDVLYVSNAPSAELQKFLSIVVQTLYPAVAAKTLNIVK